MAPAAKKSAAPADKSAPAANGNAPAAKGKSKKESSPLPPTAEALPDTESKDAGKSEGSHISKPDQAAYNAEQEDIKAQIDALQAKITAVKDKIGLTTKDGPGAERRAALRAEQDGLRAQQSGSKASRGKVLDQLKAIQDNVQKKIKDLNAAKAKAPFKTVAEVDTAIKNLERQVESGSMAIAQEKRALAEISTYKRGRKQIEGFQAEQDIIEAERAKADALRKELDDPEQKALSERYDAIRDELDQLKRDGDAAFADRNALFDERNELQKELSALFERKRASTQQYREANDRYWQRVHEERARKAERYRAQRAAEEDAKRKELVDKIREEAEAPAFESQIEDCQTLIDYFTKLHTGGVSAPPPPAPLLGSKSDIEGVTKLELRKVENKPEKNMIVRKKKGDDEEMYFVGKAKKGGAKAATSADPPPAKAGALNVTLPILSALLSLSIPPPTSHAELPRAIDDLKTKKTWFEANQKRVTHENVAKAEDRIRQLESKSHTKGSPEDNGNSHRADDALADAPTPSETVDGAAEDAPAPAEAAAIAAEEW